MTRGGWRCRLATCAVAGRVEPVDTEAEYLVVITGQYVVVHGDRWYDSRCHSASPTRAVPTCGGGCHSMAHHPLKMGRGGEPRPSLITAHFSS